MYPGDYAANNPDRPAFIMASSDAVVTYSELEERANKAAHYLVDGCGLQPGDHYSIFMENNDRYVELCAAGERSGLYYTCINSFLTSDEAAYILNNSNSKLVFTSAAKADVIFAALEQCPDIAVAVIVDPAEGETRGVALDAVTAKMPGTPLDHERLGSAMLYSSGTTGRPKGILRPLADAPPVPAAPVFQFLDNLWQYREDMVYLSPAPLYHSAPQAAVNLAIRNGATVIIMERFDPAEYLRLIEKYKVTHSQLVPTMFARMLKMPLGLRTQHDLSSLEVAIHAAAPCPVKIKQEMIEWWGPIIFEYYGATEGLGFTACDSHEWLAHPGTVGKVLLGKLQILDDEMNEVPTGETGTLWFESGSEFSYHNDPDRTTEARSDDGTQTTVNDVGYIDADGFLYLTDRKTFMIISGGVNIYPQETEDVLITHPEVADAAVFGVPNVDLGEEVKAVVQLMPGIDSGGATVEGLLEYCREGLSRQKVPRSIDFIDEMPRLPTGKLYKKPLRAKYWKSEGKSI
jgi:long-chain acyl-CoA synthetase